MQMLSLTQTQIKVNTFVKSVYNWMAIGLALTGLMAWLVSNNNILMGLVYKLRWILLFGQIALVFSLAGKINKIQTSTATSMFIVYSIINGATMSFIFLAYTATSIASTFFICAGTFLIASFLGWSTNHDLTSTKNFLLMGMIGIIMASVVNLFLKNNGMQMIISYLGVIIFTGLTAYDTQKLKQMAILQPNNLSPEIIKKGSILGALTLYLDFILMFQYLLYILGDSRE